MKAFLLTCVSLLALALLLALLLSRLELDHRLDAFLPAPSDDDAELVADQLGDSAASRMILAALEGGEARALAKAARGLAEVWREIPGVLAVHNGEAELDHADYEWLARQRLLLIPDPAEYLSPAAIGAALEERVADLGLGVEAEPWIRRDPLGLMLDLAPLLAPADSPEVFDGVWFDNEEQRALLMVMTDAPGFDPSAQRAIVTAMREATAALPENGVELTLTGPAVFSTDIDRAARSDAARLSTVAGLWLLLLLFVAWRRPSLILAGAVPLLAGVCAGLAAVMLGYSAVHGLTLAFGFTLLGVTLDYPVHLFSHGHAAGAIRVPLSLSALSSLIAFTAIWLSASPGLAQLGAFSAVGLLTAAVLTIALLPRLHLPRPPEAPGFAARLCAAPRAGWLPAVVLLAAAGGLVAMHGQLWSDDLRDLSPVDPSWLETDRELRQALRAPEARYLLTVVEPELESVLQATETLTGALHGARETGLVGDWQAVTALVPSLAAQTTRRATWLDAEDMGERLRTAGAPLGFRADAFDPFVEDLDQLSQQPDITPGTWRGTPLAPRLDSLLEETAQGWRSLVLPSGVDDVPAFERWLEDQGGGARLVDLAGISRTMAADYRRQVLISLAIALGLIVLLVGSRLGRIAELFRVVVPPLAAVAATALVMRFFGDGLTVVHLMALILVAGIGLDYALFMQRFAGRADTCRDTLWSLIICAASTGGVFLILGQSEIPLLAQLGRTAALGIGLSWVLVWVGLREAAPMT